MNITFTIPFYLRNPEGEVLAPEDRQKMMQEIIQAEMPVTYNFLWKIGKVIKVEMAEQGLTLTVEAEIPYDMQPGWAITEQGEGVQLREISLVPRI